MKIFIIKFKSYEIADINYLFTCTNGSVTWFYLLVSCPIGLLWGSYEITMLFEFSLIKISLIHSIGYTDTGGELESISTESIISE